ncbi:diguanylate cyclase (GGDEF) domain-containing protein [Methylobacterium sp. UNC378MF]|uniref:GGDEF domain-containing protein n=1 Tax=Methylobacterium sp. UNC378MF TaxID=1502748 RepID=UPI0008819C60|nr:GGDEF domain-containing protein [Methylobacterium sp. UNC378MF]SDA27358.1 diguanylate cyclase (GGDEF) domain-containing protein [Methylobacterium sp. UNC378MF]
MSAHRAPAHDLLSEPADAFSLFDTEEAVLGRSEVMLARLAEVGDGVRELAGAYRRSYHEQRRLVRLSDRMQLDLHRANQRMAEQQRALRHLNDALTAEIEHRTRLEAELRRLADTDHLTDALSRRRFLQICEEVWARTQSGDTPSSVLMLDLDGFKLINDRYGHSAGDMVLKAFVETCRDSLRAVDVIGRMGGEEFAILVPGAVLPEAQAIAEQLRCAVAQRPVRLEHGLLPISVSIGLAAFGPSESMSATLRRADAALYAAKHAGRDCVRCAAEAGGWPDLPLPGSSLT